MYKDYIRVEEAATLYNRCEETIRRWARDGKIRCYKNMNSKNSPWFVNVTDMEKLVNRIRKNKKKSLSNQSDIDTKITLYEAELKRLKQIKQQNRTQQYIQLMKRSDQSTLQRNYIPRRRGA